MTMPQLPTISANWQSNFNSETVELYRKTITYGKYGKETISETKVDDIVASIQPIIDTDLINLQEGDREKVQFKMYTNYSYLLAEDIIVHVNGRNQIMQPPLNWRASGALHHYKCYLYKIENE